MAEEIRKEESKQDKKLERLLQPPKVYSKTTATPEQIEKAKAEYIKNVTEAYNKFNNKKISEQKYKELIKTYKNDFDMETKGRRYLRMIKLHAKGKTLKSIKLFDFGCFALNKEKTQKMTALLKDNEILKKKAKATRNNAIYLSDQIGIDKQKNNLLEIKLQLKYDISEYKNEENSNEKIANAKKEAKIKIADVKEAIAQQKQRNKEFYQIIDERRVVLISEAKTTYADSKKRYAAELSEIKKIEAKTLKEKLAKKEKVRQIKCLQKEARDLYKYNMYVAKNYHPAWVSDPDIKSMFTEIADNRIKRYQAQRDFDDRIDTLKKQFIERLESENVMAQWKVDFIYKSSVARAWWLHAGKKIIGMVTMALIVLFALLGLFDSIPATSFLLTKVYVGSISVFIFIALIIFCIWVIFKIAELVRRKAGIYDVVEARFSKEDASASSIGLASKSSADEFAYLEELFDKGQKEAEKTKEQIAAQDLVTTSQKIVSSVIKEEGKWAKEEKAEEEKPKE